jgi:hypothetical protein
MKTVQIKTLIFTTLIALVLSSCTKSSDIAYPTLKQVYFSENFNSTTGSALPTGWTSYAEFGSKLWSAGTYAGNGYANMTAYGSGDAVNVSWLISPAIDLDQHDGESLSFQTCHDKYVVNSTNSLQVYISTDYNGNFGVSHWTQVNYIATLPYPYTKSYAYVNSGAIDLSLYKGTIHFAFKYTGINPSTGAYQVDNVAIVY